MSEWSASREILIRLGRGLRLAAAASGLRARPARPTGGLRPAARGVTARDCRPLGRGVGSSWTRLPQPPGADSWTAARLPADPDRPAGRGRPEWSGEQRNDVAAGARTRPGRGWRVRLRRRVHRHLLPPLLHEPAAAAPPRPLLRRSRRRRARGLPRVQALRRPAAAERPPPRWSSARAGSLRRRSPTVSHRCPSLPPACASARHNSTARSARRSASRQSSMPTRCAPAASRPC